MKVVAVSGVDGAGKSTFVRSLREVLTEMGCGPVGTGWFRFDPRASSFSAKGTGVAVPVSTLDTRHRGHAAKRVVRSMGVGPIWSRSMTALYRRQLEWQLGSRQDLDVLVADRFTLDFIADQIGGGVLRRDRASTVLASLPTADATFVLTASRATLDQRRDAAEDLEGLVRRRDVYLGLARDVGACIVDTLQTNWADQVRGYLEGRGIHER